MKLRIVTHSREDVIVEVDNFDAYKYEETLNNNEINAVAIGNVVFSRIDIKLIQPILKD